MKEHIINCSIELFGRYGIKGVTMTALATELGISKRTLYEMISSKEQLLKECLYKWLDKWQILTPVDGNLLDELFLLYLGMRQFDHSPVFHFCRDLKKFYFPGYSLLQNRLCEYATACGNRIQEGITEGYLRKDTSRNVVISAVESYLNRLFIDYNAYAKDGRNSMSPDLVVVFARGLCTIKGRAYFDRKLKDVI